MKGKERKIILEYLKNIIVGIYGGIIGGIVLFVYKAPLNSSSTYSLMLAIIIVSIIMAVIGYFPYRYAS